jgi:sulfoxide reductase catalytic subunit YedY
VDELVRLAGGVEERLYRHRCVERWAMAVPWTGFPLARLVEIAAPLAAARFVRVLTVSKPDEMPGWYASKRVFPYYEGLSIEEATNELAFLATGIYGHPLPPQHGAPIRLVAPWKYGFKSAKSLVAFQFTAEQPATFWSQLSPDRYDFSANVDPKSTKLWAQGEETMLGTEERRATLPFNGYGEMVAHLYG